MQRGLISDDFLQNKDIIKDVDLNEIFFNNQFETIIDSSVISRSTSRETVMEMVQLRSELWVIEGHVSVISNPENEW